MENVEDLEVAKYNLNVNKLNLQGYIKPILESDINLNNEAFNSKLIDEICAELQTEIDQIEDYIINPLNNM